jgi:hypothetical protein
VRRALLLTLLASAGFAVPAGAGAAPRVIANPNPVPFGDALTVKGRGWPVIEFCGRTVRLSLRSAQNAFPIGTDRVGPRGRFRFRWVPRRRQVGGGDWTLVARMRCESGKDGSPNPVRVTTRIRIGRANFVVGRGQTDRSRWTMYTRRARFGGYCVGIRVGPLEGGGISPGGEGCGGGLEGRPLDLGTFSSSDHGTFAHGMAAPRVARVAVSICGAEPVDALLLPSPPLLGFRGKFWIATHPDQCDGVRAEAFDSEGRSLGRIGTAPPPPD